MKLFSKIASHIGLNVVIQILNLATSIAVISLLPFAQMGLFAITMVVAGAFGLLATLRMEWVILNTIGLRQAKIATSCGLIVAAIVSPLALAVMFAFTQFEILNFEQTSTLLIVLAALFTFTFACQRMLLTYHLSRNTVRENLHARLIHAAVRLIASATVCFYHAQAPSIFAGEIVATLFVLTFINNWHQFGSAFTKPRLKFQWVFKKHRNILLFSTPGAIITSLGTTIVPTIVVSVAGLDAGGLIYTVQRIAGAPVKFALTTIGEVWHKLVHAGNEIAIKIGKRPYILAMGMIGVWTSMFIGVSLAIHLTQLLLEPALEGKLSKTILAIDSYKIFISTTLAVNMFNRIIIIRDAVHKKLVSDTLLLLAPLPLLFFVPQFDLGTYDTIWTLSLLQLVPYTYLAGLILFEANRWRKEAC